MPKRADLTISKLTVDGLSVEGKGAGCVVQVYPSGRKFYVVQSRGQGESKRITIGWHGELATEHARKEVIAVIDRIKSGEKPVATPPAPAFTVADLVQLYLETHVVVNCNAHTAGRYRGSLDKHFLPALGAMPCLSWRTTGRKLPIRTWAFIPKRTRRCCSSFRNSPSRSRG